MVLGPTGTGKTETALDVACRIEGEIVNCDAVQLYRGLDCATAKPTPEQRRRIPHHLLDVIDPVRDVALADYVLAAEQAIHEIAGRGRVPIVVGGSGLYLRGLLRGVIDVPARNAALRQRLWRMARRFGTPRLHRLLQRLEGSASTARVEQIRTAAQASPGYLRIPVLVAASSREKLLSREARNLGVMPGYPRPLHDLEALQPLLEVPGASYPSAELLADYLFTLPAHSLLRARDVELLAALLEDR